ncbi:bifunctional DNA primase/polymerase [Microvirga calopogonii]|uniref:bifunctional DNA primase/polymerase n=1 Tax=Microvirga calopogonii TaxID=2078013 RepID=UPI000E0DBF09|nr:bifunctional DNA primase/polymerase [Microvirga calopogonii]
MSPFASAGLKLVERGFSAIPIMPGDKIPGLLIGDEWRFHKGWNRFCDQLPGSFQVAQWTKWERAGLGVACGRGLLAVDIDREELVAAILAVLPPVVVAKKGRKGLTIFYRGDTDRLRSRGFKIDGHGVLDFLSHGKQTVLPPSLHPAGVFYEWTTEATLLDVKLDGLPEFTADHFEALVGVLKAHGWNPETALEGSGEIVESGDDQARDFFRKLNEDALANLGAWVPKLGLYMPRREPDGSWRAIAEWRPSSSGKPLHKRGRNLSFDRKGIVDFGDGEKTYTPLNVVIAAHDATLNQAAVWLGEALGYDFQPKIVLVQGKSKPVVTEGVIEGSQAMADGGESEAEPDTADPDDAEPDALMPDAPLSALTRPPGLVGEIVDWIEGSAEYPSRELALGAALGWVAALAGRGFETPSRARTNLYLVGLAPSGFGKDHAGACIMSLAQQTGLDRFLGPARFMSASGLRESLMEQPSILCIQDEFGGIIRQIDGPKVGLHNEMIRYDILGMFSRAKDFYGGSAYAQTRAVKLYNPNLCLYGLSTPDDFWSALSTARSADGFLPRFLLFNVEGPKPARVTPRLNGGNPPSSLVEGSRAVYEAVYRRGNLSEQAHGARPFKATVVDLTPEAEALAESFGDRIGQALLAFDAKAHPVLNRAREHALKLALTVAVGANPTEPLITSNVMKWAIDLAWYSTCTLAREIEFKVADNDRQRAFNRILEIVRKAGPSGIAKGKIVHKLNGTLKKNEREELIEEAEMTGRIISRLHKPATGRPGYRYFAA